MKTVTNILTAVILLLTAVSCGKSGDEGKFLPVRNVEVTGAEEKYVNVADGDIQLIASESNVSVKVEVSMKKKTSGKIEVKEPWTLDLLDANGVSLMTLTCTDSDNATLESLLNNGTSGDGKDVIFTSESITNKDDIKKASDKTVSIRLNTKEWKDKGKSDNLSDDDSETDNEYQ